MKITIPKPCHENWEAMTPEEKGRFCSVCSKTVQDFTIASDKEIIDVLAHSSDYICGNFYESQLNRNLHHSYINSVLMKFAVGFILTAGGLVSVHAQKNTGSDTLKTEEIKDAVILECNPQKDKKLLGATSVIPGDLLVNTKGEISGEIIEKSSGGAFGQMPKDTAAYRMMIRGAMSSVDRGNGEPLYILDGKVIDHTAFVNLDQSLIKGITILTAKEASKLFSGKAQNGVIIITTKKKSKGKRDQL